jgi:hypothetical protein
MGIRWGVVRVKRPISDCHSRVYPMSNLLRRSLLAALSTSVLIAVSLPFFSSSSSSSPISPQTLSSSTFSHSTFSPSKAAEKASPFQLERSGIATAVDRGLQSYEQLMRAYLARIAANENGAPQLNSMTTLNAETLKAARPLEQRKSKNTRSPLHGIPVLRKDNVDAVDAPPGNGAAISKDPVPRDAYE